MNALHCIAYLSFARWPMGKAELQKIIESSVRNNQRRDITGVLLYHDSAFLQILEGPEKALRSLLETLRADQRHMELAILLDEPINERRFPHWAMALADSRDLPDEQQRLCGSLLAPLPPTRQRLIDLRMEELVDVFRSVTRL